MENANKKMEVCVITTWSDFEEKLPTVFVNEQNEALSEHCLIKCLFPSLRLNLFSAFFAFKIQQLEKYQLYIGELGILAWIFVFVARVFDFLGRKTFHKNFGAADIAIMCLFKPLTFSLWQLAYKNGECPMLIHAHSGIFGGALGVDIGKKMGIPVVITEHSSSIISLSFSWYAAQLEKKALTNATHIFAVSLCQLENIMNWGVQKDKISVLPNFVDDQFFSPEGEVMGIPIILTISGLGEIKNIPLLLQAFAKIKKSGTKAILAIGGDGPMRKKWEEMSRSLGLDSDKCKFLGLLSRHQVREWLRRCTVFVLTSKLETFGCVIAEAQACGKPVVATASGGPNMIITPYTGILVDDLDDPAVFADAVIEVLSDVDRFESGKIRQLATERFGKKAFLKTVMSYYDRVIIDYYKS